MNEKKAITIQKERVQYGNLIERNCKPNNTLENKYAEMNIVLC